MRESSLEKDIGPVLDALFPFTWGIFEQIAAGLSYLWSDQVSTFYLFCVVVGYTLMTTFFTFKRGPPETYEPAARYIQALEKGVDWLGRRLGPASPVKAHFQSRETVRALTRNGAQGMVWVLNVTLIYPVFFLMVSALFGGPTQMAGMAVVPAFPSVETQFAFLACLTVVAVATVYVCVKRHKDDPATKALGWLWSVPRRVFGYAPTAGFFRAEDEEGNVWLRRVEKLGEGLLIFWALYAVTGLPVESTIVGIIGGLFYAGAGLAVGGIFLVTYVGGQAFGGDADTSRMFGFLFASFFAAAYSLTLRARGTGFNSVFAIILIVLATVALAVVVDDPTVRMMALIYVLFPLANLIPDFISFMISRRLFLNLSDKWRQTEAHEYLTRLWLVARHAGFDAVLAFGVMFLAVFALTQVTQFSRIDFLPFGLGDMNWVLFVGAALRDTLGDGLFVTSMLLSTLLPTAVHLGAVVFAFAPLFHIEKTGAAGSMGKALRWFRQLGASILLSVMLFSFAIDGVIHLLNFGAGLTLDETFKCTLLEFSLWTGAWSPAEADSLWSLCSSDWR